MKKIAYLLYFLLSLLVALWICFAIYKSYEPVFLLVIALFANVSYAIYAFIKYRKLCSKKDGS